MKIQILPILYRRALTTALLWAIALSTSGCGQKGPLVQVPTVAKPAGTASMAN